MAYSSIRQQSQMTSSFYGQGKLSLVMSTITGNPSGNDLPSICNKLFQDVYIFVGNLQIWICTKTAKLTPYIKSPFRQIRCSHKILLINQICLSSLGLKLRTVNVLFRNFNSQKSNNAVIYFYIPFYFSH